RHYDALRSREGDLDRRARAAQDALARLRAEQSKTEKLLVMWPEWNERMELLERLEDAGPAAAHDVRWLAAEEEVARLTREAGAQVRRQQDLDLASTSIVGA